MGKVNDFVKRFAVAFVSENPDLVRSFVRGWFKEKLQDLTVADLDWAVQHDMDLWDTSPNSYKALGLKMASENMKLYQQYKGLLTTDNILKMLGEDRPDFASYILNDKSGKAYRWLEGMLDKIRLKLWEQDKIGV